MQDGTGPSTPPAQPRYHLVLVAPVECQWLAVEVVLPAKTTWEDHTRSFRAALGVPAEDVVESPETGYLFVKNPNRGRSLVPSISRIPSVEILGPVPEQQVRLHQTEVEAARDRGSRLPEDIGVGSRVFVLSGPYKRLTGQVEQISSDRCTVAVRFTFRSMTQVVRFEASDLCDPEVAPEKGEGFRFAKVRARAKSEFLPAPQEARPPSFSPAPAPPPTLEARAHAYAALKLRIAGERPSIAHERRSREIAAAHMGIGRKTAEAIELIFCRRDVPEWVRDLVRKGLKAPTAVARVLRAAVEEHGEILDDPSLHDQIERIRAPR